MVVGQDGAGTVLAKVVDLTGADIKREHGVDQNVDEEVQLVGEEAPDPQHRLAPHPLLAVRGSFGEVGL